MPCCWRRRGSSRYRAGEGKEEGGAKGRGAVARSIRILNSSGVSSAPSLRPRLRLYDAAVSEALVVLGEASDRVRGNVIVTEWMIPRMTRLGPFLPRAGNRCSYLPRNV